MASRRARVAAVALVAAACSGDDGEPVADRVTTTTTAPLLAEGDLDDGVHAGIVTALDPASRLLVLDPIEVVDGEVVNPDDASYRLTISTEVVVRLRKPCCDLHDHTFAEWFAGFQPDDRTFYGTATSRYEVTVDGGEVVLVEEMHLDR